MTRLNAFDGEPARALPNAEEVLSAFVTNGKYPEAAAQGIRIKPWQTK